MKEKKRAKFIFYFLFLISFIFLVNAVNWNSSINNFYGNEDTYYEYNVSKNVTDVQDDLGIDIVTSSGNKLFITWDNGTQISNYTSLSSLPWFSFNSSSFILSFNATLDSQTGKFRIPFMATDNETEEGINDILTFIINATNNEPSFQNIEDIYYYPTYGSDESYNLTVFDEEEHYPLNFTIEFFDNCTYGPYTGKTDGQDCDLFEIINLSEDTAYFNYTANSTDVGVYWAQITVTESDHTCPHIYCHNQTYEQKHTIRHNISIVVLDRLNIDASNCHNKNFTEGVAENCTIEVSTSNHSSDFTINSTASFLNYQATPSNLTWFLPHTEKQSSNFIKVFNVTVNASRYLVGNWRINLTAFDNNTYESNFKTIDLFVNWTGNTPPQITSLEEAYNISINIESTVSFNVVDLDFIIEDKNFYQEDANITIEVINLSSSSPVTGFYETQKNTISHDTMPIDIIFNPTNSYIGNYLVNVTSIDNSSVLTYQTFNLEILHNEHPKWNQTEYSYNFTVNSTQETTKSNITNLDLDAISYAYDPDNDDLTFSLLGNYPPEFDITSSGILNFFPWKADVGYWEFQIIATDEWGLTNSTTFKINVSNINSPPKISEFQINGFASLNEIINANEETELTLIALDNDLLITKKDYYDEVLNISLDIINTTPVQEPISFSFIKESPGENTEIFQSLFTPQHFNSGNYTIKLNLTDATGEYDSIEFNLTILAENQPPQIQNLDDKQTSILNESFFFQIIATDQEDDYSEIPLNYFINRINLSAPNLTINSTGFVSFNFSKNESYAGVWEYNVSVTDSESEMTYELFNLTVYGTPNITLPLENYVFNFSEDSTNPINFTIDYMVEGAELSYQIYLDKIIYYWVNQTTQEKDYNYTNLSLVDNTDFNWSSSQNTTLDLTLGFEDETYGKLKNFTLVVLKKDYPLLNYSINYKLNISHLNSPLISTSNISYLLTGYVDAPIELDLTNYFYDADSSDIYYNQQVNFSLNQSDDTGIIVSTFSSFSDWILGLNSNYAGTFNLSLIAKEIDIQDPSQINKQVTSSWFSVRFDDPPVIVQPVPTPSSGGGSTNQDKDTDSANHYSLKIIAPQDITLYPEDYIELNFSVINNGNIDLEGIDLSSLLSIGGEFSEDILMEFSEDFIDILKVGEMNNYTLKVSVGSHASGDYRVTIYGNVTKPSFYDWGVFHITVLPLDEAGLTQYFIFTEKLITENPECLELRELYEQGKVYFEQGDYNKAQKTAQEIVFACEEAISLKEQIRYFDNKVRIRFIFTLVTSAIIFLSGFMYYIYKRIRFNKLIDKEII